MPQHRIFASIVLAGICKGAAIDVLVNGKLVNRCFDASPSSGKILLQSEGFELDFRRFELMPLGKK